MIPHEKGKKYLMGLHIVYYFVWYWVGPKGYRIFIKVGLTHVLWPTLVRVRLGVGVTFIFIIIIIIIIIMCISPLNRVRTVLVSQIMT